MLEYECAQCRHKFVLVHPRSPQEKHHIIRCPKCSSARVRVCFEPIGSEKDEPAAPAESKPA